MSQSKAVWALVGVSIIAFGAFVWLRETTQAPLDGPLRWAEPVEGVDVAGGVRSGALDPLGEGRGQGQASARWAELTGEAPAELVLTVTREYVPDTVQIFDVSDPARPRQMMQVVDLAASSSDMNEMFFRSVQILDGDGDGLAEVLISGIRGDIERSRVYRHERGMMRSSGDLRLRGTHHIPLDHDEDGRDEIVSLRERGGTFEVTLSDPGTGAALETKLADREWLPRLYDRVFEREWSLVELPALSMTIRMMKARGVEPMDTDRAFDVAFERLFDDDQLARAYLPSPYRWVFHWPLSSSQRARLTAKAAGESALDEDALLALSALLTSSATAQERAAAVRLVGEALLVRGHWSAVFGSAPELFGHLTEREVSSLCEALTDRLSGDIGWDERSIATYNGLEMPLSCEDVALLVLGRREAYSPSEVDVALATLARREGGRLGATQEERARSSLLLFEYLNVEQARYREGAVDVLARHVDVLLGSSRREPLLAVVASLSTSIDRTKSRRGALLALLRHDDASVRVAAVSGVPDDEGAIGALTALLPDEADEAVRAAMTAKIERYRAEVLAQRDAATDVTLREKKAPGVLDPMRVLPPEYERTGLTHDWTVPEPMK